MAKSQHFTHDHQATPCPECGADLVIRYHKQSKFWGCSHYPECHYSKPFQEHKLTIHTLLTEQNCPECAQPLAIIQGQYGLFIGCSHYPNCQHIEKKPSQDPTQQTVITCPQCQQGQLQQRHNRHGKNFWACDAYPKCKYALNYLPSTQECPQCHWPIMVKKGKYFCCPQKTCGYQIDAL